MADIFVDDTRLYIFENKKRILIQISLKLPYMPFDNESVGLSYGLKLNERQTVVWTNVNPAHKHKSVSQVSNALKGNFRLSFVCSCHEILYAMSGGIRFSW